MNRSSIKRKKEEAGLGKRRTRNKGKDIEKAVRIQEGAQIAGKKLRKDEIRAEIKRQEEKQRETKGPKKKKTKREKKVKERIETKGDPKKIQKEQK